MTSVGKIMFLFAIATALGLALWSMKMAEKDPMRLQTADNAERIASLEGEISAMELEVSFLKALYIQGCGAK